MNPSRDRALAGVANLLGLPPLARLVQRGRDPQVARYTLELADGRAVAIGTIQILWSQTELAKVLAVTVGCVPPLIERNDWRNAIGALITHATDVEELDDEALEQRVLDWLDRYARGAVAADRDGAAASRMPFLEDDEGLAYLYVNIDNLAVWVRRELQEQIREHELRAALRDLGFEMRQVNYNSHGGGRKRKRTSARYYRAPLTLLDGAPDVE